ncbi:hypothetical protein PFICI_13301 [Pestalotiopsis fici W106-1]|uniref:Transcription factor domain-containing protein n=1 Tax=Pestalotiopsis fici (strain W106-1 / CGMCC3.15140) TaxID=1229662 RepID=W3WNW9_PESFW|nr:uncharacterized protein PFICI_13301 [Pestalotiopsis fici W106-1]ETS74817.1 hypothetical protein PFICI_13301 [Pestalotiopsis fici W106-1]
MPACKRCSEENKPCFYVKSRRGIRDAKERSLISDKPPSQTISTSLYQIPSSGTLTESSSTYGSDIFSNSLIGEASFSPTSNEDTFLEAYYTYFHPSHSMMLPKDYFLRHMALDPDSVNFLLPVVRYIGSHYCAQRAPDDLEEAVFAGACGQLPMTSQSVLGLLLLSIAALGNMKFGYQNGWTSRAISMAFAIGMQHKTFADNVHDAVQAECHRRVFWGLYLVDSMRVIRDPAERLLLHETIGSVDLPCEEWEYEAGRIPRPISLAKYDEQNIFGTADFSSWAYLIDMCRISNELVLPYHDSMEDKKMGLFDRADSRICDWLIKVPQWKTEVVDSNGLGDMILLHAIALAQQNRLRIRQCASRQGLNLQQTFPLGPARGPHRQAQKIKGFGWKAIPIDVQAADSVCRLFLKSFPTKNLSPLCLPGLLWVAIAYLDACVFLGLDTPGYREKLSMLLHIMTAHGKIWGISRKIAEEVKEVAQDYAVLPQSPSPEPDSSASSSHALQLTPDLAMGELALPMDFDFSAYQNFGDFNSWNNNLSASLF